MRSSFGGGRKKETRALRQSRAKTMRLGSTTRAPRGHIVDTCSFFMLPSECGALCALDERPVLLRTCTGDRHHFVFTGGRIGPSEDHSFSGGPIKSHYYYYCYYYYHFSSQSPFFSVRHGFTATRRKGERSPGLVIRSRGVVIARTRATRSGRSASPTLSTYWSPVPEVPV